MQRMQVVSVGVYYFLPKLIGCHGNNSWQIGKRGPDRPSACKALSYSKKIVKFGPVYPEIFRWICHFLLSHARSSQMSCVNSGITGPKFKKILHDIEASLKLLMYTLTCWYSILFWYAKATNDGSLRFFHRIGCHDNVPWNIRKRGLDRSSAPKTVSFSEKIEKYIALLATLLSELKTVQ